MERTISVWFDRNIRDQFWTLSTLTGLVISVGRTGMSFSIWQNYCPSTAVLYPAHKNNNQTRGGLGRVCATRMGTRNFRNFKSEFLLNGKRRPFLLSNLFFECKHPIIDKSIVITEPAVPSTRLLGWKLYPTNMQSMLNKDLTPFTQSF